MSTVLVRPSSIEEEELAAKRAQLSALQAELVEGECYLVTLSADIAAFEARYMREVGVLYAELDEWKARIAELIADQAGTQDAQDAANQARAVAEETSAAIREEVSGAQRDSPSPELRNLFRRVAKQVHPDLAIDEADRLRRTRFMAEANTAFKRGDAEALKTILASFASEDKRVIANGAANELERLIEQIHRITVRLRVIAMEIAEVLASEIAKLMAATQQVSDISSVEITSRMVARVLDEIYEAKQEYAKLKVMVDRSAA